MRESVARHEAELDALPESEPYKQGSPDQDFHFLIVRTSKNPLLIELLCLELYPLLRVFRSPVKQSMERRHQSVLEHKRILSAMEEGDSELSEILMRRHIAAARRSREVLFPEAPPKAPKVTR